MIQIVFAFLAGLSLVGMSAVSANAQSPTETDAKIAQALIEHPDYGILIVDAVIRSDRGSGRCDPTVLSLVSMESKVARMTTHASPTFGIGGMDGGVSAMKSGLYLVAGITCATNQLYHGHFAKVMVRAGEIVAAGTLVVDVDVKVEQEGSLFAKSKLFGRPHVEDFSPKTIASLKERIPVTFSKARKSPLIMLSDEEKRSGLARPRP